MSLASRDFTVEARSILRQIMLDAHARHKRKHVLERSMRFNPDKAWHKERDRLLEVIMRKEGGPYHVGRFDENRHALVMSNPGMKWHQKQLSYEIATENRVPDKYKNYYRGRGDAHKFHAFASSKGVRNPLAIELCPYCKIGLVKMTKTHRHCPECNRIFKVVEI